MPFNFATGQMDNELPGAPAAPVAATSTTKFDFSTGMGGVQTAQAPEAPGTDYFSNTKKAAHDIANDPLNLHSKITDIPHDVGNAFKDSWQNLKDKWHSYKEASDPNVGFAGKLGATLKLVGAGAGVAFSPVTALFKGGEDIPVAGTVVKGIDTAFTAAGEGGSALGQEIIEKLPIDDPKEKQTLKEGVGDIFSLAAQIALGKATEVGYGKLKAKYGEVDAHTIVDKAKEIAESHPDTPERLAYKVERAKQRVETPETSPAETSAKAAAEKVTDPAQYATPEEYIQSKFDTEGFRPVEEGEVLPSGTKTKFDFTTGEPRTDAPFKGESQSKFKTEFEQAAKGGATSKVGKDIEAKAIEAGLTKGFEGTAEYDPITIKNQAARIADLVTSDIDRVGRIVRGEEALPEGLRAGALIKGVEDYAIRTKNAGLISDLAKSHLTSETSLHAQELRLLRERDPNSVVKKIQDIEKIRKEKVEKVKGAKIKKEAKVAKTEAKKASKFTLKDADELLQSLIC